MSNPAICTTPMCTDGQTSVSQMNRTYNVLSGNPAFDQGKYQPTVMSIQQAFDDAWSVFSPYIPFNPTCCTIAEIGQQADALTADMLKSVGAAPTGPGPSSNAVGFNWDSLVTLGMVLGVAVIVGNVAPLVRKR